MAELEQKHTYLNPLHLIQLRLRNLSRRDGFWSIFRQVFARGDLVVEFVVGFPGTVNSNIHVDQ